MSVQASKIVLLLYAGEAPTTELERLAGALRQLGADVRLRSADGAYDALCDEVAAADTALFWR